MRHYVEFWQIGSQMFEDYRIAGFCHEDFNVASHGIRNIKIRYILSRELLSREIL